MTTHIPIIKFFILQLQFFDAWSCFHRFPWFCYWIQRWQHESQRVKETVAMSSPSQITYLFVNARILSNTLATVESVVQLMTFCTNHRPSMIIKGYLRSVQREIQTEQNLWGSRAATAKQHRGVCFGLFFSFSILRVWNFPDRPRPSWNHSSVHNQFYARNTLLAFTPTKEIPTHEWIAVQNICMRSASCLGEICS